MSPSSTTDVSPNPSYEMELSSISDTQDNDDDTVTSSYRGSTESGSYSTTSLDDFTVASNVSDTETTVTSSDFMVTIVRTDHSFEASDDPESDDMSITATNSYDSPEATGTYVQ